MQSFNLICVRHQNLGLMKISQNWLIGFFLRYLGLVVVTFLKMQLNVGRVSLAMTREKGQVWPAADLG